jgi:hypothetical protein
LSNFVTYSKISHFHCSGALTFDGIVRNTNGGCIVAVYGCFWLGLSQVGEGESKNDAFLAVQEEGAKFGFGQ